MRTFFLLVPLFSLFGSSRCESPEDLSKPEFLRPIRPPTWNYIPKWPLVKELFPYHVKSPINILTSEAVELDLPYLWIHFPWNSNKEMVSIENTGYYLEVLLPHEVEQRPYVTGGPLLNDKYVFEQLHFHWGETDECGSENHFNGQCHSTEVHIVFYNEVYGSYKESVNHPDGIAVLALFGDVTPDDNAGFKHLIHEFSKITEPETKTNGSFEEEFKFLEAFFQQKTYFTFPGALTTPMYSECVTWIVFPTPYGISSNQLNAFRKLKAKDGHELHGNDYPLQDYADRPMVRPPRNKHPREIFRFVQEVVFTVAT